MKICLISEQRIIIWLYRLSVCYLLLQLATNFYKVRFSGICMYLWRFRLKKTPGKYGIRRLRVVVNCLFLIYFIWQKHMSSGIDLISTIALEVVMKKERWICNDITHPFRSCFWIYHSQCRINIISVATLLLLLFLKPFGSKSFSPLWLTLKYQSVPSLIDGT